MDLSLEKDKKNRENKLVIKQNNKSSNSNLKYPFIMDIDTDNLKLLVKHNRRIVERAYTQSLTNANYAFPKKKDSIQIQSDAYDIISLQSKVSEAYNLHQQNLIYRYQKQKERSIVPISMLIKSKQNKKIEPITKTKQLKLTLCATKLVSDQQNKQSKKFLSLSPHKFQHGAKLNQIKSERSNGIKITRQFKCKSKQKNLFENLTQNIVQSIKKITERCYSADTKSLEKKQGDEITFHLMKKTLSKQRLLEGRKFHVSQRTADTTATIQQKYQSNPYTIRGITRHLNHITISPFTFS